MDSETRVNDIQMLDKTNVMKKSRPKPGREIYRPGSGPLRKKNDPQVNSSIKTPGTPISEEGGLSETKASFTVNHMKKPEMQRYQPGRGLRMKANEMNIYEENALLDKSIKRLPLINVDKSDVTPDKDNNTDFNVKGRSSLDRNTCSKQRTSEKSLSYVRKSNSPVKNSSDVLVERDKHSCELSVQREEDKSQRNHRAYVEEYRRNSGDKKVLENMPTKPTSIVRRSPSPNRNQNKVDKSKNTPFPLCNRPRQSSEPPMTSPQYSGLNNFKKDHDMRVSQPLINSKNKDRYDLCVSQPLTKPPIGKRVTSFQQMKKNEFEMPPRFQKLAHSNPANQHSRIEPQRAENWDGHSQVFSNRGDNRIPSPGPRRSRGRGKVTSQCARSVTPDGMCRPEIANACDEDGELPPSQFLFRTSSQEDVTTIPNQNIIQTGNRNRRSSSQEDTKSPDLKSSSSPDTTSTMLSVPSSVLDWSEEVDENERLQNEMTKKRESSGGSTKNGNRKEREPKRKHKRNVSKDLNEEKGDVRLHDQVSKPTDNTHTGGLLYIPPPTFNPQFNTGLYPPPPPQSYVAGYNIPGITPMAPRGPVGGARQLFDPKNPTKPIVIAAPGHTMFNHREGGDSFQPPSHSSPHTYTTAPTEYPTQFNYPSFPPPATFNQPYHPPPPHDSGSIPYTTLRYPVNVQQPTWYDPYSESFRSARCNPHVLLDIARFDTELQFLLRNDIIKEWAKISHLRQVLQRYLQTLLQVDLKFCETENVEMHMWKLIFYNVIEVLRKRSTEIQNEEVKLDPTKEQYKKMLLDIIEEGTIYYESLLEDLQRTYKFNIEKCSENNKTSSFASLSVISAQKLFICLGDLARYKESANGTSNFVKARHWYMKANQANTKNGRPYNQLAILAIYVRRKLDAVYYYMRSLMASNPFHSARESLLSLFDENRKKYELLQRKRKEELTSDSHASDTSESSLYPQGGLRREIWIRPDNGQRIKRTSSTSITQLTQEEQEIEGLNKMSSAEVNKLFVTSYVHVQGKLFTKVGMDMFPEAAVRMLRQFRVLLQHSPIPFPSQRLLQLLALNMFAIENTQLKDSLEPGLRSALQESALAVSIEMFNLLLERCNVLLLRDELEPNIIQTSPGRLFRSDDVQLLMPAIKVWCDWLLCHSSVWNPPPNSSDFRVGYPVNPWCHLATLINHLRYFDDTKIDLIKEEKDGYVPVRLPEDQSLSGFTPLMIYNQDTHYKPSDVDMELCQDVVRVESLLFFGTEFLCGVEPPVLRLLMKETSSEYVSVVDTPTCGSPQEEHHDDNNQKDEDCDDLESSGDEFTDTSMEFPLSDDNQEGLSAEIRSLRIKKEELHRKQLKHERQRRRVHNALLRERIILELEILPKYMVPDTNCFIDFLPELKKLAKSGDYTLTVPLIVMNELDGLTKGAKGPIMMKGGSMGGSTGITDSSTALHVAKVAAAAKSALSYFSERPAHVRCCTTKGSILCNMTINTEEELTQGVSNDDRILSMCLNLCKDVPPSSRESTDASKTGKIRRVYREVVLLTADRNLRVKALARDLPVRDVKDFLHWAGLG